MKLRFRPIWYGICAAYICCDCDFAHGNPELLLTHVKHLVSCGFAPRPDSQNSRVGRLQARDGQRPLESWRWDNYSEGTQF